ncbi:AraC family transcriptional regulator [Flavobacterium sp. NKUCC04_CG]|uniref:AraC family transcriptional regulator n=1 Tax=Flavobacterium sp. NKUCC04_CG TaxID=2842121 RepID=UPI001C5B8452|nr:AraC family transcriptional regulator [Flavobacterium sp. NKUCC04_CG]MBW3519966.1 AraC family transcriptional regulator [Flavobacterium sp. NKUCC04_CG]
MTRLYFVLFVFLTIQEVKPQFVSTKNPPEITYEQLNDSLRNTLSSDANYEKLLNTYIEKAKSEHNKEQLFEGYYRFVYSQHTGTKMHTYTDSLLQISKQLPPIFYIRALQTKANCFYFEKKYIESLEFELLALSLINKDKEPYAYHKSLYGVGQVYFYMQEYNKAYDYYHEARLYFEHSKGYNHLQGYFNALYREAFSLYYLKQYNESRTLIEAGIPKIPLLKPDDVLYKEPYLKYILGLNNYQQNQYKTSIRLLNEALSSIVKNDDFANEAVIYYYLGLNYWKLNEKSQALFYFKKVDFIYTKHQYCNLEIKDAYLYLINYYKEQKDSENELLYTNKLLNVTLNLQNEYNFLMQALHTKLDIKNLQREKERLENDLNRHSNLIQYLSILGSAMLVAFPIFIWFYNKRKKEAKRREFQLNAQDKKRNSDSEFKKNYLITENIKASPAWNKQPWLTRGNSNLKNPPFDINDKVIKNILNHLDSFEKKKHFLKKDLNLNDLAQQWNTNRSYLSQCINMYKGKSFVEYLNTLRINYFLTLLGEDPQWCKFKVQFISDSLGFSNSRSFSNAFSKITGMSPHHYIQQQLNKQT